MNLKNDETKKLVRGLSQLDATMIVVGSMIGSGIFLVSAESARLVGSPGWLLVAWGLAAVLTITGALSVAELAAMMPRAGGPYVFLREAYSPGLGFLYGWSQFLIIQTGTIAAVAVAFANFTGVLIGSVSGTNYIIEPIVFGRYAISLSTQQLVAILLIVLLTVVNTRGLKTGKLIQNVFTFTKTAALIGLILVGLLLGWNSGAAAFTSSWWNSAANGWSQQAVQPGLEALGAFAFVLILGRAMTGPLFSQSAWDNVTFIAGEVRTARTQSATRAAYGVRWCCLSVSAREYRIYNHAVVACTSGCIAKPGRHVGDATDLRHARHHRDVGGNYDFNLRVQQRIDSRRRAGQLRDGARWLVLRCAGKNQPRPRASHGANRPVCVGRNAGAAADRHLQRQPRTNRSSATSTHNSWNTSSQLILCSAHFRCWL